ncbi:MAG: hypothetical protein K6C36_01920 [Clostridia bacterium]|nr:hypothetical protein [Clostridia bacterium]
MEQLKDTVKIDSGSTLMIAHRGVSGLELENTCSAFVAAGNRSYYGIETDVHVTKDGKYIVFHDDNTERVAGDCMVVENTTFETLRSLRLVDRDGKRGRADLVMPSLEEYILICKKYGKKAILELKNRMTKEQNLEIASIIDSLGYLDSTVFISFALDNLKDIRSAYPDQTVQFLDSKYDDSTIDMLSGLKMDFDTLYSALDERAIAYAHSKGVKVNAWTCDDPVFAADLVKWGIDYLTSNILE